MADPISSALTTINAARGVLGMVGSFALSHVEGLSMANARHQARLLTGEGAKELLVKEGGMLLDQRGKLMERFFASSLEERLLIKRDIEYTEGLTREVQVRLQALSLPWSQQESSSEEPTPEQLETSEHWLDRFQILARGYNEPWRTTLLARALQKESMQPGALTPRMLWLIGTLEKSGFETFSAILDLSCWLGHHQLVPLVGKNVYMRPLPVGVSTQLKDVGSLYSAIEELGLLAGINTFENFPPCLQFHAAYGEQRVALTAGEKGFVVHGIILTRLGRELASLYDPVPNDLGRQIFEEWVAEFKLTGTSPGHWA